MGWMSFKSTIRGHHAGHVKPSRPVQNFVIGSPMEELEHQVVQEVLAQIPKQAMEVDSEAVVHDKVKQLEQKVAEMHAHTSQLQQVVQQTATEQAGHILELQNQLNHQRAHFEQATSAQATQLQTFQESFHEQFKQQVSHQQTMLDGMFERQMSQFESLLAKHHRPE
jgi:regulator of replication initiation timing